eukprot:scaffold293969_cov28-Prasinocladus_malaysianus.AAC.1
MGRCIPCQAAERAQPWTGRNQKPPGMVVGSNCLPQHAMLRQTPGNDHPKMKMRTKASAAGVTVAVDIQQPSRRPFLEDSYWKPCTSGRPRMFLAPMEGLGDKCFRAAMSAAFPESFDEASTEFLRLTLPDDLCPDSPRAARCFRGMFRSFGYDPQELSRTSPAGHKGKATDCPAVDAGWRPGQAREGICAVDVLRARSFAAPPPDRHKHGLSIQMHHVEGVKAQGRGHHEKVHFVSGDPPSEDLVAALATYRARPQ